MIGYILLFGIAAGTISMWTEQKKDWYRTVLFFFAGLYFTASAVKLYLGEAQNTLSESFWDIEDTTYLHYGIIFFVVSAAVLLAMKLLFLSFACQFMQIFNALYILTVLGLFLFYGRIDNRAYCIMYVCCMLAASVFFLVCVRQEYGQTLSVLIESGERRKSFLEALPFISIWVVMTGIYLPSELYFHNTEEFTGQYLPFLGIMLSGSIAVIFLLDLVFVLFLPKKFFRAAYLVVAGIGCAGYLQEMLLNGRLDTMNGESQSWSALKVLINSCIWLGILLMVVAGAVQACLYLYLTDSDSITRLASFDIGLRQ